MNQKILLNRWRQWTKYISEPKTRWTKYIFEQNNALNQKRRQTDEGDEPEDIKWTEKDGEEDISKPKKMMNQKKLMNQKRV